MKLFEEGYKMHGKNYTKIRELLGGTKSLKQVSGRVETLQNMYRKNPNSVPKSLHRLVKYERMKCDLWSEEETIKFEEGLIKYGRDWDKI